MLLLNNIFLVCFTLFLKNRRYSIFLSNSLLLITLNIKVRAHLERNRKGVIYPFRGCQISRTSCTYAVPLTCLMSWHEKDVEHGACDPVFTSLIPSKTYESPNKKGRKTFRCANASVIDESLLIILAILLAYFNQGNSIRDCTVIF